MYKESDLVRIAKRENNKMRNYLVVNRLQGKHVPVEPARAMEMFSDLAKVFQESYKNENLLCVGFAETATAIGAGVAFAAGAKYMQTTREIIPDVEYLFFSEEHSHATEQKLVKDDIDKVMDEIDRIVFVEDEVTTGKTILNIIQILEKQYPGKVRYAVASILNGMNEESLKEYQKREIDLHYLVKTNHDEYPAIADSLAGDGTYVPADTREAKVREIVVKNAMNARRLVDADAYQKACEDLWNAVNEQLNSPENASILVVGTEEFMYPALYVAKKIQENGNTVRCHSTTRSPIAVSSEERCPLHVRYELKSLYDKERVTFIYDIAAYDMVVVITDAYNEETEGQNTLINALKTKNNNINLVRWC